MLHGWLGNENVMWTFESALPKNAVIVSPRAPMELKDGGYGWFERLPSPAKHSERSERVGGREVGGEGDSFSQGLAALREFISRLPETYPVDPTRLYVMGFSQGAAACYSFALSDPQSVAGVIALAGFLPDPAREWIAPNCLTHKPVFISHGVQDKDVPLSQAQEAREALAITGAAISYHEYETGHKLNAQGMRDLKGWLAEVVGD